MWSSAPLLPFCDPLEGEKGEFRQHRGTVCISEDKISKIKQDSFSSPLHVLQNSLYPNDNKASNDISVQIVRQSPPLGALMICCIVTYRCLKEGAAEESTMLTVKYLYVAESRSSKLLSWKDFLPFGPYHSFRKDRP